MIFHNMFLYSVDIILSMTVNLTIARFFTQYVNVEQFENTPIVQLSPQGIDSSDESDEMRLMESSIFDNRGSILFDFLFVFFIKSREFLSY